MNEIYKGLRVLELSNSYGAYCGKMLAGFGAEVIKIEKPGGDDERKMGPFAPGEDNKIEKSLSFAYLNTGKKSVTLDIYSEEGKKVFLELIKTSDALIETTVPGTLEANGTGYETLKQINPKLILLSITPFGQTGRHNKWNASSDIILDAMGGCMAEVGYEGQPPLHLGYDMVSNGISMFGLFALQAAYHNRLFTGEGTHIDISMQECICKWRSQALGNMQKEQANIPFKVSGSSVRQGLVNCKDGLAFVMIGGKWKELMGWFEEKGLDISVFDDPFYFPHTYEVLTPWDQVLLDYFNELGSHYTKTEFMTEGQKRKIPTGAVVSADSMMTSEHLEARGFFTEVDHPVIGKYKYPKGSAIMTKSPYAWDVPAPLLGADNTDIIGALGFDTDALAEKNIM